MSDTVETPEQLGYIVDSRIYVLANDADDAIDRVKKGEGSVVARKVEPKPQPKPQPTQLEGATHADLQAAIQRHNKPQPKPSG